VSVAPGALAVGLTLALEWTVREPPQSVHPVAWYGRAVAPFDRDWASPMLVGAVVAAVLPLAAGAVAFTAVAGAGLVHPFAAVAVAGAVLFTATSLRMLLGEARGVVEAAERDTGAARDRLPALAGRDADGLTPGQLRSAAVESASENLADGLVGPLLAFTLLAPFSIAAGSAAAAWMKGVNTLDSMLGYRSKAVGTPSARLDDAAMWLPARVSAALIAVASGKPTRVTAARAGASETSSPNAGWPMSTLATALSVRLEKPETYELNANASLPSESEALAGLRVVRRAGLLAYGLAALLGVAVWL